MNWLLTVKSNIFQTVFVNLLFILEIYLVKNIYIIIFIITDYINHIIKNLLSDLSIGTSLEQFI